MRTLRDFGFGKQGMEEMIQDEVEMFKSLILKSEEEPFDFINQFNLPILNALWRLTVGERFEYDDPKLMSIVHRLTESFKRFGRPESIMIFTFPWMTKLWPGFMQRDQTLRSDIIIIIILGVNFRNSECCLKHHFRINHDIMDLMSESIDKHLETLDMNAPRDFTDTVLIEIKKTTDPESSFYGDFGLENLRNVLFDLFLAGSETTSTTLTWAALYMVR